MIFKYKVYFRYQKYVYCLNDKNILKTILCPILTAVRLSMTIDMKLAQVPKWSKYGSHWRKYAAKPLQRSVLVP
jgi:hypothetical protein